MAEPLDQSASLPGSLPGEGNSDSVVDRLTFTKDELDKLISGKLRGSGRALKEAQEKLAILEKTIAERDASEEEARRKKLERDGEIAKLLEIERNEKLSALEKYQAAQKLVDEANERESKRLDALNEKNKSRIKTLPKELQDLVPSQLSGDDLCDFLSKLESKVVNKTIPVAGFGGVRVNDEPENQFERAKRIGHEFLFGKKDKGNRK